jgi:hypothetical protein
LGAFDGRNGHSHCFKRWRAATEFARTVIGCFQEKLKHHIQNQ